MTTENVTILFTDLVGSTQLQSSVSPDVADRLRRDHFTVLRQAIAEADGREVKNLGDGLMAVFPSASAGLACAVAMQQGVEFDGRSRDQELGLRVGLAGGEVTREDDDYFGDPVIEAARLCARCEAGQILATELVRLMAGRRNPHPHRPLGALELKGLPDPVESIEILWEPRGRGGATDVGLPTLLEEEGRFPFAGREKEAEQLFGAWGTVSTGTTRLVLIAGEPGIGKTRLTSELAAQVATAGGTVLAGRCDELVGIPYQPFAEALRWQLTQPGGVEHLGPTPGELVRLVPEMARIIPELPPPVEATPDSERLALFQSVHGWLEARTQDHPVLLVLDDLHWADMGTLLLLRHVVANSPVAGLLAVGTYRDTDLDRTHPLSTMLSDFHRRGDVERIALAGLDDRGVSDLMVKTAGHDLDESGMALALALHQDTGGNPFFVGEVLRHLAERGSITQEGGRWVASRLDDDEYLPEGIRQVVGRRLSVLPEGTQKILSSASVVGARFDLDLLSAVTDVRIDELLDAIEPAIDAHLVLETGVGRYQFAHALVRSTLHAELSTTRRARTHLAVAEALEKLHGTDLDPVMSDLAHHWGEAGAATVDDVALHYARRAAELAMERAAPDEAARWFRVARERLDGTDPAMDAELLCRQGVAEAYAGHEQWRRTLLDSARAAERLGNASLMAEALGVNMRVNYTLFAEEPDEERIELLTRAIALVAEDPVTAARLSLALATELTFVNQIDRKHAAYVQAQDFLEHIDDPVVRFRTQVGTEGALPFSLVISDFVADYRDELLVSLDGIVAARDSELEFYCLESLAWCEMWLGTGNEGALVDRVTTLQERVLNPLERAANSGVTCHVLLKAGRFGDAVAMLTEAASRAEALGVPGTEAIANVALFQQIRESDGGGGLAPILADSPGAERERAWSVPGPTSALLAWTLAEAGRLDEARTLILANSAQGFADIPDDAGLPVARVAWAEAAAIVGDRDACRALIDQLSPQHDVFQVTGAWYAGSTARYLAILSVALGDDEAADHFFTAAERDHVRADTPPWLARTRVDWAELLLAHGDRRRARDLAGSAIDVIGDLDLTITRGRAERILATTLR